MVVERMRVVQVQVAGYEHLRAFDEVSASLAEGLQEMGFDADVGERADRRARNVVLGAHVLAPEQLRDLPDGTIVYNHEQIDAGSLLPPERLAQYARFELWDYSAKNVAAWAMQGIAARHVPIGWSPNLERIDRTVDRPIDVLFYGSLNERRRRVLDALAGRGVRVEAPFGVYGEERDALIGASKLVINIQYYETRILEMVRLSYLLANGVPVVSETAPGIEIPPGFDDAAAFAPYDRLVETVRTLLADPAALQALGARGRERMRAQPWSRSLRGVLTPVGTDPAVTSVELVCGPPGEAMAAQLAAHGGPGAAAVARAIDELLAVAGTDRATLGPPPMPDAGADAAVANIRSRLVRELRSGIPPVVADPGLCLLLPFFVDAFAEAGTEVSVTMLIEPPMASVEHASRRDGATAIETVLRWLSHVLFADAFSRELDRRIVAVGGERTAPPSLQFAAMTMADAVRDALVASPPQLDTVDEHAGRYLDAMALYLPLLTGR